MQVLNILIILVAACVAEEDLAADLVLSCPEKFKEGPDNIITVTINNNVGPGCAIIHENFKFYFRRPNDTLSSQVCETNRTCPITSSVNTSIVDGRAVCGCVKKEENGKYTFQMKYFAQQKLDEGGNVTYQVCIANPLPFQDKITPSCTSIQFDKTETDNGPDVLLIVGATCGSVAFVAIVAVVGYCLYQRNQDKGFPVPTFG